MLGTEILIYQKLSEYDSPEAALEDLSQLADKVLGAASSAQALLPSSTGSSGSGSASSQPGAGQPKEAESSRSAA